MEEQLLKEYVGTYLNPKYNGDWDLVNSKFPELSGVDKQILKEYVGTYLNPKYNGDWAVVNSKFPELFPVGKSSAESPMATKPEADQQKKNRSSASPFVDGGLEPTKSEPTPNKLNDNRDFSSLAVQVDEKLLTKTPRESRPVVSQDVTTVARLPKTQTLEVEENKKYIKETERLKNEAQNLEKLKEAEQQDLFKQQNILALQDPELGSLITQINKDLIDKEEREVTDFLNKKFSKFGFHFESTGVGDAVIARTIDGKKSIEIDLDPFLESTEIEESEKLRKFISSNSQPAYNYKDEDYITKAVRAQSLRELGMKNDDGTESTVKFTSFEQDGKHFVIPTLFPKNPFDYSSEKKDWLDLPFDQALNEARLRGEVFEFDNEADAQKFAEGDWKNVNAFDIEGQRLYRSKGLDYYTEKKKFENYTALQDEVELLEKVLDRDVIAPEEKLKYPQYFAKDGRPLYSEKELEGRLDKTIAKKDQLLEQVFDVEFLGINDGPIQKTREEFDLVLDKKQKEIQAQAIKQNNEANSELEQVNLTSMNLYGVPIEKLYTVAPKTSQDVKTINDLVIRTKELIAVGKDAANKFEVAKTYYDAKWNKAATEEYEENFSGFKTALADALENGRAAEQILLTTLGIKDVDINSDRKDIAAKIAEASSNLSGKQSRVLTRLNLSRDGEFLKTLMSDPLEAISTFTASSFTQILPYGSYIIPTFVASGMATGAAIGGSTGGAPGAVAGAATGLGYGARAGMSASFFALEYTNSILDVMKEKGYDITDPLQVEKGLMDESVWSEGGERGVKRGIPIAIVDYLSAGLAGKIFKVSKIAPTATRVGALAAERVLIDPTFEMAGEFAAQKTAGQEVNLKDIAYEGLGGIGSNTSMMGLNMYLDSRNQTSALLALELTDINTLASQRVSDERISNWANNMQQLGKIDADVNQRIQQNVGLRREARDLLSVGSVSRLTGNTSKSEARVMELLAARQELTSTQNRREVNSDKIKAINQELAELSENKKVKPKEEQVNLDLILGTKREGVSRYQIGGKVLSKEQFNKEIANMSAKNLLRSKIKVDNDEETQIEILNKQLDAIQKQTAGEVPVQPGATVSQEVAQGEPQAEPQVVAEEGQVQEVVTPEIDVMSIPERQAETESKIKRKDLFTGVGNFSSELGGSDKSAVPINHREINGIEFVEYAHPDTGSIDVIVTGTSDTDFVGFYRMYEDGKPTNKWSSKFENQSRNKESFKTMISGVQSMLPEGHEYTEKTSISTDGLRVWGQQLDRGYELQYDDDGKVKTQEVAINGDAIENVLGIPVPNRGNFDDIIVNSEEQFNTVKTALLPYLQKFGLNENNIRRVGSTVKIDLPVLKKQPQVVTEEGVQEELAPVSPEQVEKQRMDLDMEVKALEDLLSDPNEEPLFKKSDNDTKFGESADVVEDVVRQMNDLPSGNVTTTITPKPQKPIDIADLESRADAPVKRTTFDVIKGIPAVFSISDQLRIGNVTNPNTGNVIDRLFGGLGFGFTKGHEGFAWANTTKDEAQSLVNRAVSVYNNNKALFDDWWAKNPEYNGLVPLNIAKMAEGSIMSNEALYRVIKDNFASFPKKNKIDALNYLTKNRIPSIIDSLNKSLKNPNLAKNARKSVEKRIKALTSIQEKIKSGKLKSVDQLLDPEFYGSLSLPVRAELISQLTIGSPNKPGEQKTSGLPGKNTVPRALLGIDQEASVSAKDIGEANLNKVSLSNSAETITEPAMKDIEPRQIIAIYGIDVLNPGVKETVHPNYKFGVNGRPIGVLENSVSIQEAYPFAYTNILESLIAQEEKGGEELKAAPIDSLINEKIPVGIGLPNLEFIGAVSQGVMSNAQKLSAWINKSFPSVIMSTDAETFANVLKSDGVRVQLKGDEVVYGVTVDGDIYINPDVHNSDSALFNTTIHEFGHVWLDFLDTTAEGKRLLNRGVDLVKKTSEYQDQLKKFNGNQSKAANEALAILIGNRGETIVNASLKSKFQEWLLGVWKYVKDKFKLSGDLTPQQIQDLTLDQFLGTAIADLFSGKALPVGDIQLKKLKNPEAAFSKSDSIDSIVQKGRANGFSEESIKIVLDKRGFTEQAINEALAKDTPAAKKVEVTEEFAPGYNRVLNNIFGKDGIVATSRIRGRSEEEAMQNAIDYLQQDTKVYENATDVQREAMVRNLRKEFKKREKSAPTAEKVVGKPKKKKVTVDEMAALKSQIRLEARAAREAKGDLNTKRRMIADAINKMATEGKITTKKAEAIVKRASRLNVDSEISVNKFIDYVSKVFADAEYASKLSTGNTLRKKIKSISKNKDKAANLRDLGVKFSEIDPSMVKDIDKYNTIASKIFESINGSTLKGGVKFADIVRISDVSDYINDTIEKQNKEILNNKIAEMSELLGVEITEDEYFMLMESINNDESLPKKYKDGAIRKAINKAFDVYSAMINQMMDTGVDAITGEGVSIDAAKKKVVSQFMDMDLSILSDKESLAAIDSLLNFIQNGSTAKMAAVYSRNLGEQKAVRLDKKNFKSSKIKKYFSEDLGQFLVEQFTPLDIVMERMFKGVEKAGDFMFEAGISALKKGKSLAQSLNNKIVDKYFNTFYKSKPNGQAFNTIFNTVERGMTAHMMRTMPGTESEINTEFKKKKSLLEQSIANLNKGNDNHKKLADVYAEVYDKLLNDSDNYDDVVKKADPKNVEAVEFWQNEWANKYGDLSDLSESIYNKTLGKDLNYTPLKVSSIGKEQQIDDNSDELNRSAMSFHSNNQTTYQRETGVLMKPTLDDKLPSESFIDLSFDSNNANSMYDALVDLNTANAVRQISGFFNSDAFKNIVPNIDDRKILKGRVNLFIRNIRNKNPYDNDEFAKAIRGLQNLAALGAGRALAGPTQALKQTIPVIANTIVNAGSIDLAAPFNEAKTNFINNSGYAIANRSAASINQIETLNKLSTKVSVSLPSKLADPLLQLNELQLKLFLQKPDAYVARAAWMTYYEKSLRQQGIDTKSIDYNTHQINDKAADYAQRMVDRQQNISDMDLAGKFVGSKNAIAQFVNKTIMPFSSFRINQSARLGSDWATLTSKVSTNEDKVTAARSIGGFFVELATFRAVSATISVALASLAALISGEEEDEEDREKLFDTIIKGSTTSSIIDVVSFLPYMDGLFQAGIAKGLDVVQDMLEIEDADKFPFYDSREKSVLEGLGMIGIAGQRAFEFIDLIDVAYTRDYKDDFGRTKYISEDDSDILKKFVRLNILSSVGIASPEIKTMTRRTLAKVKRRSTTNKSGIKGRKGSSAVSSRGGGGGRSKTINKSDLKKYYPEFSKQIESATGDEIKAIEKQIRDIKKNAKDQVYGGKD